MICSCYLCVCVCQYVFYTIINVENKNLGFWVSLIFYFSLNHFVDEFVALIYSLSNCKYMANLFIINIANLNIVQKKNPETNWCKEWLELEDSFFGKIIAKAKTTTTTTMKNKVVIFFQIKKSANDLWKIWFFFLSYLYIRSKNYFSFWLQNFLLLFDIVIHSDTQNKKWM